VLERIAEGLWVAATPHSYLGLRLGTRMTVVRLASGDVWVHSPVHLDDGLRAAVEAIGPVRHVVAPSLYHHLFAGEWRQAFAGATLYGPKALASKRKDLRLDATLEEARTAPWAAELAPVHIDGCLLDETVFVHGASRTVVSSDLTENFVTHRHLPTRLYLQASGTYGKVGWPRPLRIVYRDHAAATRSIDALLQHDFDRIVIAHGEIIARDGKAALRETFRFLD
jgi:hypothetical protein